MGSRTYTERIQHSEVTFEGLSFTDWGGRVFKWNEALYRGIPQERFSFSQNLFDKGIMQELIEKKLFVETELTTLRLDPYELVLKHRLIPFVSYPHEWCDMMLKDAALLHLDFCLALDDHDLISGDAHPLNILFDGCQPIFVDFGSIDPIPVDSSDLAWSRYEQFCSVFIRPLCLMAQGHGRLARWLLHDYEHGVLRSDVEALTHRPMLGISVARDIVNWLQSTAQRLLPFAVQPIIKKVQALRQRALKPSAPPESRRAFLAQIRREVENINLLPLGTEIPNCNDALLALSLSSDNCAIKRQVVHAVLADLRPSSALDIGNGTDKGFYSLLAARCGSQVIYLDPDEASIKRLYVEAKKNNLPILPLLIDFISPSYDLSNKWFSSCSKRLQCDLVFALNLVDRLVFSEHIRIDTIVDRLSDFSSRWLLVDFVPQETPSTCSAEKLSVFSRYTLDNFIKTLKKQFRNIKVMSSHPEPRVLLLCEK